MNYKDTNRNVYDAYAKVFEDRTDKRFREYVLSDLENFFDSLNGFRVLDIGAGPGRESGYLRDKGCIVSSLDISREMFKIVQR